MLQIFFRRNRYPVSMARNSVSQGQARGYSNPRFDMDMMEDSVMPPVAQFHDDDSSHPHVALIAVET